MYQLNDTITAVSSPSFGPKVIIRISGPGTVEGVGRIFSPAPPAYKAGIITGSVQVDDELKIDATLYLFFAPCSYTGQTLAELHLYANAAVAQMLMGRLLSGDIRMAGAGEFTARAYLNGKIDLAQAEAVGEIIASSNRFQLAAAQKLLKGRLAQACGRIRSGLMDCLSLLEAGLDFSGHDIEFISRDEAVDRLVTIKGMLDELLTGSISYEGLIDLPAVGIAGATNAGKSSLLNKLLGSTRSIVSPRSKTTRDVLSGQMRLGHNQCVLFDCAGLILRPENILDELAQQAAVEAIGKATVVIFCVDVSKDDWAGDIAISKLIEPKGCGGSIAVATKCDLLASGRLQRRLAKLGGLFGVEFLAVSVINDAGMEKLKKRIDEKIIELTAGAGGLGEGRLAETGAGAVALTARHKQAVTEAIDSVAEAIGELQGGSDEVAAMLLRAAYQGLGGIEAEHVDERILENIFGRFCIGK